MIENELAENSCELLTAAILQIADDIAAARDRLPRKAFQERTRLAALATAGKDISVLATAAIILVRRAERAFAVA